jgi:hypothetical protein
MIKIPQRQQASAEFLFGSHLQKSKIILIGSSEAAKSSRTAV